MVFENFSQWLNQFSIEDVFRGDLSSFLPIFYLAISIAIYAILIWHFYRFIARRDIFKLSPKKHAKIISFLKYFFLFPFVAIIFFAGFAIMLLFLTKALEPSSILITSFAVIVAIRITAYYSEDLSRDLAKMLPLALLGVFLYDPSYFRWADITDKINSLPNFLTMAIQLILFIILVEWILRILLKSKQAISLKKQQAKEKQKSI
ncbi:MAG: hypothetical protein QHH19_02800 [Candidatus Thermoplasmatota archaeon]|nr:hypothetical protein [Candidatus Thermoplasmatota archaeon]